jgi:uncharacterized protein YqhQ
MSDEIRLGGMALANGVLVHGPTSWACAIRGADGELKVVSARKTFRSADIDVPFLRGPLKIAEVLALLPAVRRELPEARLPLERPRIVAALGASAVAIRAVRGSRLGPLAQELLAALAAVAPAALSLRDSAVAEYHGAEHISIGTYEHGERREREHERCGSHLLGPLLLSSAAGSMIAGRAPAHMRGLARAGAAVGALAASVEVFSWMVRHEDHPLARALARPGHELQHRFATAEPSAAQLDVAEAALQACLELERDGDRNPAEPPLA